MLTASFSAIINVKMVPTIAHLGAKELNSVQVTLAYIHEYFYFYTPDCMKCLPCGTNWLDEHFEY